MTDSDRALIDAAWPEMSATKIAARIGFSKTAVLNYLKRSGQYEKRSEPANFEPATLRPEADGQDTLGRLRELRDSLKVALVDSDAKTIPAIAREYRACVEEIGRLEAEADGDGADPLADLARAFADRLGGR